MRTGDGSQAFGSQPHQIRGGSEGATRMRDRMRHMPREHCRLPREPTNAAYVVVDIFSHSRSLPNCGGGACSQCNTASPSWPARQRPAEMRASCVRSRPFVPSPVAASGSRIRVVISGSGRIPTGLGVHRGGLSWTRSTSPGVIMAASVASPHTHNPDNGSGRGASRQSGDAQSADVRGPGSSPEPRTPRGPAHRLVLLLRGSLAILLRFLQRT